MGDISALACKLRDGRIIPVAASESTSSLLNLAREIRISGLHNGESVYGGCVWNQTGLVKKFRCELSPMPPAEPLSVEPVMAQAKKRGKRNW
jgi:hypothetical protein